MYKSYRTRACGGESGVYEKVVEGTVKVARAVVQGRGFRVTEVEEEREWWRRRPLASVAREPWTSLSFCCRLALLLGPAQLLLMGLQKEVAARQTSSCSSTTTIDLTERIKTSRCARRAYFSPHHRSSIHSFSLSFPPSLPGSFLFFIFKKKIFPVPSFSLHSKTPTFESKPTGAVKKFSFQIFLLPACLAEALLPRHPSASCT